MWLTLLAVLALAAPATADVQVQTVDGQSVGGRVTGLTAEALDLETADGPRHLAAQELLKVAFPAPAAAERPSAWVTLTDGSRLVARSYRAEKGVAQVELVGGASVSMPTRAIENVRFREHTGPLTAQWDEIAAADRTDDLLVVRKDEALDFLGGTLGDVADDVVTFELDGESVRVKRQKVDGLFYHHAGTAALAPAHAVVVDAGGSEWHATTVTLDGDTYRIRSAAGVEFAAPPTGLARIDFSQENVQYLADLKPESVTWAPYFGDADSSSGTREFFRLRTDAAFDGGPLRLGGKEYGKGLAAHSRTEISYRLPDAFGTFRAIAGIDDRMRPRGNVQLSIIGDDRTLWDEALTGHDSPRDIELNIQGVRRLKIVVDFGADLDIGDVLDLCEARVLK